MRTILILFAAATMTGCAVYTTPYAYPAPVIVYQDPWPVRVPVYPPAVVQPLQPR